MKNTLVYVLAVVMVAVLLLGFKVQPFAKEDVMNEEEGILFYDETVVEVIGVEEIAPFTWILPSGEHDVITIDGSRLTVEASNGSWQYIQ